MSQLSRSPGLANSAHLHGQLAAAGVLCGLAHTSGGWSLAGLRAGLELELLILAQDRVSCFRRLTRASLLEVSGFQRAARVGAPTYQVPILISLSNVPLTKWNQDLKEWKKRCYCLMTGYTELHCKGDWIKVRKNFCGHFCKHPNYIVLELKTTSWMNKVETSSGYRQVLGLVLHCHRPKASVLGGKPWHPCAWWISAFLAPVPASFPPDQSPQPYLVTLALVSLLIINPCFTQRKSFKIHTFFSETKVKLLTYLLRGWMVNIQALKSLIVQLVKNSPAMRETWV